MNPRSTDCEADALTTTPSRRLIELIEKLIEKILKLIEKNTEVNREDFDN